MLNRRRWLAPARVAVSVVAAATILGGGTALAAGHGTVQGISHRTPGGVPVPEIIGPVPETASSYPFGRPPFSLAAYGYEEQEFFVKGAANVYDYDSSGNVVIRYRDVPYETRIVVYRPVDPARFSGTVLTEILNMTNNYDFPVIWAATHNEIMADSDVYVGVTSSPNAIAALQKFDPVRYRDLSMAAPAGDACASPGLNSTAATEGGLVWDMLSQVGAAFASHGRDNPLGGIHRPVRDYLSGYSQSGGYLLRYLNVINPVAHVYDGFLLGSGVGAPELGKCGRVIPQDSPLNVVRPTPQPVLTVNSQTDFRGFGAGTDAVLPRPDSDTPADKYRLWQVPGSSHNWNYLNWFHPSPADLAKIGGAIPAYNCDITPGLSGNFPQQYPLDSALADLDTWARQGVAPPSASRIEIDAQGNTVLDHYGNAVGGMRTPFVDVPVATYYPSSTSDNPAAAFGCRLYGHVVPLPAATLSQLYPNHITYVTDVYNDTEKLVTERFLTRTDATVIEDAANLASIPG
ncbi:MAG: hypothetical protein JO345_38000 [Streptosporangiaceae bacterium]|nr:hypothetical protein [Streptosporangiaceae bacterium]